MYPSVPRHALLHTLGLSLLPLALAGCPSPVEKTDEGEGTDEQTDSGGTANEADGTDGADGAADGTDGNADGSDGTDGADGTTDGTDGAEDGADGGSTAPWYADADGDGFGDPSARVDAVEAPAGHVADSTDCDDSAPDVNPDAAEVCDGIDNDCDGATDPGTAEGATLWYADIDGDSYGDPAASTTACAAPAGHVADNTDCAPAEATAFPGSAAWEHIGDGVDQDCDGYDGCDDLDCDGLPDLVLLGGYDGDYVTDTKVYFSASGFADSARLNLTANAAYTGTAADLDGDGFKELLVGVYQDSASFYKTVDVYWGSETGPSSTPSLRLPAAGVWDLQVDDLDDDGYPDILVGNLWTAVGEPPAPTSTVYWGSALGHSSTDRTDIPTEAVWKIGIEDLDGDGDKDLVFCNYRNGTDYTLNSMVYYQAGGDYSTANRTLLPTRGCKDVDIADFNHDGRPDILFTNFEDSDGGGPFTDSWLYLGTASGFTTASRIGLPTAGPTSAVVGDANNDGELDVLFGTSNASGPYPTSRAYLYYGTSGGPSASSRFAVTIYGVQGVAMEDIDNNGYADLIFAQYSPDGSVSRVQWGSAAGFVAPTTSLAANSPYTVVVGDLNADGFADLVFPGVRATTGYAGGNTLIYYGATGTPSHGPSTALASGGGSSQAFLVGDAAW